MDESARVIKNYTSAYKEALNLIKGESVTVEPRECEWPGWLWATDREGRSGWVPEAYLNVTDATAELLCDYDATELDAEAGDAVEILERQSCWALCRKTDGTVGWRPEDVLEI